MNRLEILDGETWESLVSSDLAVLMLGTSDSGLENLPYTVIWAKGEKRKEFAGTGIDRLLNRLRGVRDQS